MSDKPQPLSGAAPPAPQLHDTCAGIALLYGHDDEYASRLRIAMETDDAEEMEHVTAVMVALLYSENYESAKVASKKWSDTFKRPAAPEEAPPPPTDIEAEEVAKCKAGECGHWPRGARTSVIERFILERFSDDVKHTLYPLWQLQDEITRNGVMSKIKQTLSLKDLVAIIAAAPVAVPAAPLCIDCGVDTQGSARCPSCWESRCGAAPLPPPQEPTGDSEPKSIGQCVWDLVMDYYHQSPPLPGFDRELQPILDNYVKEVNAEAGETRTEAMADVLFEKWRAFSNKEDELCDVVARLFDGAWEDYGFDDYDSSLEIYGVPNDYRPSKDAINELLNVCGFAVVYVNHLDGFETHYSAKYRDGWRTPEARHRNFREWEIGKIRKASERIRAAAASRIAQLERTIQEQTEKRMTVRLDEHCVETIERLTPDGGEDISFRGIMGGVKLIWVGKSKNEREAALTQAQAELQKERDANDAATGALLKAHDRVSALMEAIEPFVRDEKLKVNSAYFRAAKRVYEQVKEKI